MALDSAIELVSQRSTSTSANNSYIFTGKRSEIDQYLQAVDIIQHSIASGSAHDHNTAKSAIQIAMPVLVNEMHNLLNINNNKSTHNPDSTTYSSTMSDTGSNSYIDDYEYRSTFSVTVINDIQSILKRMNAAGYMEDCKKAYVSNRKRCIDDSYQKLDVQKLSSNDARTMEWHTLELVIKVWMKSAKICFRKILPYEKHLCEIIFGDDMDDDCFIEMSSGCAIELLEIATSLSCVRIASDRLFRILELYKTFTDLLPEMNKMFNAQSSESFRTKAGQMVPKLAGVACMIVEKFEKDLFSADLSQHAPVDKIHSLCRYVMDYVYKLGQNKQTLMELSLSKPPLTPSVEMNFTVVEPQLQSKLPFHVMWIIMCLVYKLEDEAKGYKYDSDTNFYLMNNLFYVVKKIDGRLEVKEMIGDDCFEKVSSKFDQAKAKYLRLTLGKVLSIIEDNTSLQKRLKGFNTEFKKLQINLEKLRVPDFQLLKDIRVSMEETLVPAYSSFLEQLRVSPCSMVDVKFSVEELKIAILGFFPST
ncbi:putative exocyst complex component Exo70, cullin repeat-like-containing domain superfamily [Helianthus annuus]|uniref:Exocyst subunit Exo70 family protein n=1 Tax=Helianthus annuus TaxID=4232 RepID=A0A251U3U5_HELAN|nr:exocyst complex component EXO70B1 [Helianthus annuus]KAJ0528285.1 putative exocyst complex component Exo70, cullin repeat-like-containing domain superfamily [Helianthus annuus]KAJ0544714.1 putative exocyst complex component Exo70, cullin repeat-like-containing domain superfamily [Helianthus annuus]